MRRLITAAALVALAAPLLATAPSNAAPADIQIKPGALKRGPDIADAHLEGTTIRDGDVTVELSGARAMLYGKWNDFYIVATGDREWGNVKLLRVSATGATKRLAKFIDPFNTKLDSDGGQVAYSYGDSTSKPTIAVYDLKQGDEVAFNAFASLPNLLDFDQGIVVMTFLQLQGQDDHLGHDVRHHVQGELEAVQLRQPGPRPVGLLQQGPVLRRLPGAHPPQRPGRRDLDELRRADRGGLPRRQTRGDDRLARRRHRARRRHGAQDRRRTRRALLDQRVLRPRSGGRPPPSC